MGPAGKEFVYKDELRKVRATAQTMEKAAVQERLDKGLPEAQAKAEAREETQAWLKAKEAEFNARYERELMNPREALSLGSISRIVQPGELRTVLGENLAFLMRHYQPGPFTSVQREFH
jgi:acetyl-CoA carboxylase carboxyltransferase component